MQGLAEGIVRDSAPCGRAISKPPPAIRPAHSPHRDFVASLRFLGATAGNQDAGAFGRTPLYAVEAACKRAYAASTAYKMPHLRAAPAIDCSGRWGRDSNSWYGYPYGSLANCWFQPLTHPTGRSFAEPFPTPFGDWDCKYTNYYLTSNTFPCSDSATALRQAST